MRTFSANFITQKNKRADGPKPINLITFGFATPVYVSDRDITPSGGSAHAGIVKNWAFIDSNIVQTPGSDILGMIEIADIEITVINSLNPRFSAKFTVADPPENVVVTLYQWFYGLQYSEKEIIFKGQITGQIKYDEYTCTMTVRGIFDKYNKQIGADKIITPALFPDADPDEYGKMSNIIYGDIEDVPCLSVESGDVNSLVAAITKTQTSIELSDASYFPASGTIGCDAEKIHYAGKTGNTLTGCTRAYSSTTATTHDAGAPVWEVLTRYVYQVAGHPVKAIGDIFCDTVRITSICTKYTGQTGNILSGYAGQAVFTVPSRLTRQQAIDLLVSDGMTISDAIAVVDTITVNDGISVSDTIGVTNTIGVSDGTGVSDTIGVNTGSHSHQPAETPIYVWKFDEISSFTNVGYPEMLIDGNMQTQTYFTAATGQVTVGKAMYDAGPGAPIQYRYCFKTGLLQGGSISYIGGLCTTDNTVYKTGWLNNITTWAAFNSLQAQITTTNGYNSGMGAGAAELWLEIQYNPSVASAATGVAKTGSASKTGTVTKTGTVSKTGSAVKSGTASKFGAAAKSGTVTRNGAITLSGNSVADVRIGKLITANVQGYQDDASGTYTGTPSALIARPDHVFKHLWCVIMGAPSADLAATSFTAAGSYFATNSYAFGLLINKVISASDLLVRLAFQCRSRFIVAPSGAVKLIVRQLSSSSVHAIPKNEIKYDSVSVSRSPSTAIINLINIFYDLDNTQDNGSSGDYWAGIALTDATSIARYGQKEWKGNADIFLFDAVRLTAMASHVGNYYLSYHKRARRMPQFGVFLDNMEIEAGDIIAVTHPLDAMSGFIVEVQKIIHHIGSTKQIDWLEITTVENGT